MVGPIACALLCRDKGQQRAVLIAFISLFVLGIIYAVGVVLLKQHTFIPYVAAACLAVPVVVYFVILQVENAKATLLAATEEAEAIQREPVVRSEVYVKKANDPNVPYVPRRESVEKVSSKEFTLPDLTEQGEYPLRPDEPLSASARFSHSPQDTEKEYKLLIDMALQEHAMTQEQARIEEPEFINAPEKTIEVAEIEVPQLSEEAVDIAQAEEFEVLEKIGEPEAVEETVESAETEEPEVLVEAAETPKPEFAEEPDEREIADTKEPEDTEESEDLEDTEESKELEESEEPKDTEEHEEPTDTEESEEPEGTEEHEESADTERHEEPTGTEEVTSVAQESFDSYYQKAESYSNRGVWPLAAVLFEKSGQYSATPEQQNRALFSALSAYLKAKKTGDARRLLEQLKASDTLTPQQELKLTAIQKMLP